MKPEEIMRRGDILVNANDICERYHRWYYDTRVWATTKYMGIRVMKSVSDLWNYQEILFDLKPRLVIEFGTFEGGSALFFADVLSRIPRHVGPEAHVISVDINHDETDQRVKLDDRIDLITASSISAEVRTQISMAREACHGPCFAILDSDHRCEHVYAEMMLMRDILKPGDWLIVEDGNINGHPVQPEVHPGPWEAIKQYELMYPEDYIQDRTRESKFGFTFAPEGFLVRR